MKKRGQAATEFLTTYGWAILILLIVIALIYGLNLFSPKIQNSCVGGDPIECSDVRFTAPSTLTLVLTGSGIASVTNVIAIPLTSPQVIDCTIPLPPFNILTDNVQAAITANCPAVLKQGNKFGGTATVCYKLPGSTYGSGTLPCAVNQYQTQVLFSGTVE